jgi:hypothetical protein
MSRVFDISFEYKGSFYTALICIVGEDDESAPIKVATWEGSIQIILPTGRLMFSIEDVVTRLAMKRQQTPNGSLFITRNISMQLLNLNG